MAAHSFSPGAIVQLNSGGPQMTVLACFSRDDVPWTCCSWFIGQLEHTAGFPAARLRPLRPSLNSEVTPLRANGQDPGQLSEKVAYPADLSESNTVDVPFYGPNFSETLYTLERQLEQICVSKLLGLCYLDEDRRLIQILDDDPALREAIEDYYSGRIHQMQRWVPTDETSQPAAGH